MKFLLFFALILPYSAYANRIAATSVQANQSYRGEKVAEVEFKGSGIPAPAQAKFLNLKGKLFSPSALRAVLLWVHENGGESLVEVSLVKIRGGLKLVVEANQRAKVLKIEFKGNQAAATSVLLSNIGMKEGYEFEKDSVEEAIKKIGLFYSRQGYLAANISHEFNPKDGALTFIIHEGEPTLLSALSITPLTTVERRDIRNRYEREIHQAFGLHVGDRIQRDRVLDGIQAIKDWLRDHDFLMAKDPTLEYKVDETGQVGLNVNIQYGPRIRFGFRGNSQFSYRELMVLVGEVKEVSSGSDYLLAVKKRVLEAYRDIGLANAQISTLVREDANFGIRYVSLIVDEGKKIPIESLDIEGIYSMDAGEAKSKFLSFASRLVQRNFFHEPGINQGAELFADYLKSRGYLSAKIEFVKIDFNEKKTKARVSLLFSEGAQTIVNELKLSGIKSLSNDEVKAALNVKEGEPFDIFAFERGLIKIEDRYQELGNLNAQIVNKASDSIVRYSRDHRQVSINIEVEEGPVFKVGDIVVRGNQKTHARVAIRELPFISGDVLTTPLVNEAEENLRKLNLFSTVTVRPIDRPGQEDVKDILILVEEGVPGSFDIVPGFRNDLGLRLGFEFGYQNLGGWNRSVNAKAVFNRRVENYRFTEYNLSVGFREPYLAGWPVALTSNISLFNRIFPSFDASVNRLTVGVKRDVTRTVSGLVEYSLEKVKIANVRGKNYQASDAKTDYIGSITPGFVLDSRNDRFNPSKGVNSVNRFEVASQFFGSEAEVGYYRFTTINSSYFRLLDDLILATAVNIGWERSNVPGKPIPTFKLFRLGGLGSIRGLPEDSLEVETRKNINGILGFVNYRTELRIPITGSFGTALFWDAGNLMVDRYTFSPAQLRSSVGTGLRYNTAVGPVVLDFAWRLQKDDTVGDTVLPEAGSNRFKIHFSIGVF